MYSVWERGNYQLNAYMFYIFRKSPYLVLEKFTFVFVIFEIFILDHIFSCINKLLILRYLFTLRSCMSTLLTLFCTPR